MILHAPAKINLFLELHRKRPDGFHDLETVMAPISLFDSIQFRPSDSDDIRFSGRFSFPSSYWGQKTEFRPDAFWNKSNLIFRAAKLLQEFANTKQGAQIDLEKRIPFEAGLGGASSDAATTLIGLNQLWGLNLSQNQLGELAAQLGSDVPFFLQEGFAICQGRGEVVTPLHGCAKIPIVVCKPPVGLSTPKVFAGCKINDEVSGSERIQKSLLEGDVYKIAQNLENRLEEFARPLCDWLERLSYQFSQVGSLGSQMSGSGTSYFGIFASHKTALRAANRLSARMPTNFVFVGHTLAPRRV